MATSVFDQKQYDDLATGSQIEPVTQDFDESKGVAGRVDSIIKTNSPLMQTAQTRAAQQANAKGLRNSSMAVQAGQQAVIETATPIANADASLYQQQALKNQDARNSTNQFNSNARTTVGLTGLEAGQKENQFGRSLMEQARQFDTQTTQQGAQFDKNLALQQDQLTAQREQFAQQLGLDVKQLDLQRDQLTQQQRQFLDELDLKGRQLTESARQSDAQLANQRTIAQMDADNRIKLAEVEAGFKKDIAGNENIANAWGTMMQNINQIQNNPDMEADAKRVNIQNQIAAFQSFTGFWKKATGGTVDVGDLLNFGVDSGPGGTTLPPATDGKKETTPGDFYDKIREREVEQGSYGGA